MCVPDHAVKTRATSTKSLVPGTRNLGIVSNKQNRQLTQTNRVPNLVSVYLQHLSLWLLNALRQSESYITQRHVESSSSIIIKKHLLTSEKQNEQKKRTGLSRLPAFKNAPKSSPSMAFPGYRCPAPGAMPRIQQSASGHTPRSQNR